MTNVPPPLCLHCIYARWPLTSRGWCANCEVKEEATDDARTVAGSCGIDGRYFVRIEKESKDVGIIEVTEETSDGAIYAAVSVSGAHREEPA